MNFGTSATVRLIKGVRLMQVSLYLQVSAVLITKQKSLGWSKTWKRKRTFEFIESIGRKDQLNTHRLSSLSS